MAGAETRGLFFSDLEGSTALALRLGDSYDDLLERHRVLMRQSFAAHGGTEQSTEGDSFFVTFPTAVAAVRAAIDAQRALLAEAWTPGDEIRVRMGVHVGAVRAHGPTDLTGVDIHLAARVMSTGHGGQIVVTRGVVDQLLGNDISARSLGEHQLKDIPRRTELFQIEAAGLPTDFPPPRGVGRADVIRLPRVEKAFFGRDTEVKMGLALVNDKRVVTLVGPPGAGKTRLALELAWQAQAGFAQAVFVDLAAVESDDRVAQAAAATCGVGGGDSVEGIVAFAAEARTLLVLDNCEHVATGAADVVATLVDRAPLITVLATSQVPLGVGAESLLPIGPLEDEAADGQLCAVQLFTERAAALGSPVDDAHVPDVLAIVERLDRIPLAVELAASLTPTLSPREIAARLDDRFRLLADFDSNADRRHATLLQALASSFERLGDAERILVRRLAVCVGQFSFDAVEGLAADLDIEAVLPIVHRLVRFSWLVREQAPAGSRYRMLESLREFARRDAGDVAWENSRRAHARYFLGRHAAADPDDFPNDYAAFAEVDEEIANLLAAIDWAAESREELDAAAGTAMRLTRYLQARPGWHNTRALLGRLLEAGTRGGMSTALLSQVMGSFAFYRSMADGVDEPELVARAHALAEESGDPRARMRAAHWLGQRAGNHGHFEESLRWTNHLIELATTHNSRGFQQMALYRRSLARLAIEGIDAGEADLLEALQISTEIGDQFGVAFAATALVDIALSRGNLDQALKFALAGKAAAEESGHGVMRIISSATLAQLTLPPDELLTFLQDLVADARRLGSRRVECDVYLMLCSAARRAGDLESAQGYLEEFEAAGGAFQMYSRVDHAFDRALLTQAQGDSERTKALMLEALSSTHVQAPGESWRIIGQLAHWGLAHPDPERNREIELSAVTAYRRFGDPRWPAEAAAWRAEHPDLAAGTDHPMPLDEVLAAILEAG